MFKKLCVVLVVTAVLVAVAVFAWPESVPIFMDEVRPVPQAARSPQPPSQPAAQHAKVLAPQSQLQPQPALRPAAVASAASTQQPAPEPAQLKAQRETRWRAYRTARVQGRVERLQQALETARSEGRASDIVVIDKLLAREQARIKLLTAERAQP